jgi:hypothetical protein
MPSPKDPVKRAEWLKKLSQAKIGKYDGNKNPNYGKHLSEETKQKQREKLSGEKNYWFGKKENLNPNYRGGIHSTNGYIYILLPEHPFANNSYVLEHRLVAERCLGRYLKPKEVVHHINKKRDDNRPENLYLFKNNGKHMSFHRIPYPLISNLSPLSVS